MASKRITLADIARADGTHVTTVSLAMRNSPKLPEATRRRIQELAEKMGYRPDPVLRALVSYREGAREHYDRKTLAYVTNWTTRWGWKDVTAHPQFFDGAKAAAERLGYRLEHYWLREPGLSHGRLSRILNSRGIDGLIIASHAREMEDSLALDWEHFAAVKIDFFPHYPTLNNVTNNQCGIMRLAMRKVLEAGYTRIGCIMHRGWDLSVDRMWTAGYLVEQQQIPETSRLPVCLFPAYHPVDTWIHENQSTVQIDATRLRRWLDAWQPEVIITNGIFVRDAIEELGLRVPRDVCLVDLFLDRFDGTVAGVQQNHDEVGAAAISLLAGQLTQNIRGIPRIPTTTFIEGTWHDGATLPLRRRRQPAVGVPEEAAVPLEAE
ncbi:MAG: LacI family DNA-binding transcriptional regulator [Verrucomicrobiota bacterium JB022]|nr:LacI family DNA-binding transcriptional regulator [Verrucomicrobiota bacterium JB022]